MSSRLCTSRAVTERLFQGVAILFLLYTGVDITIPQYHLDESIGIGVSQVLKYRAQASETETVALASESIPNAPRDDREGPRDEDCFCCCSHVMPSPVFVDPGTTIVISPRIPEPQVSTPAAPIHRPYHPPRNA